MNEQTTPPSGGIVVFAIGNVVCTATLLALAKPLGDAISNAVFHSTCGRFAENPVEKSRALLGDQALATA